MYMMQGLASHSISPISLIETVPTVNADSGSVYQPQFNLRVGVSEVRNNHNQLTTSQSHHIIVLEHPARFSMAFFPVSFVTALILVPLCAAATFNPATLHFSADNAAEVYVNGRRIAGLYNWGLPCHGEDTRLSW